METPIGLPDDQGFCLPALALAVVDRSGSIVGWSSQAERLLNLPSSAVSDLPVDGLLAAGAQWAPREMTGLPRPGPGRTRLRHADGGDVEIVFWVEAMGGEAGLLLIHFVAAEAAVEWGQGVALLRTLLDQQEVGISLRDTHLRLERTNITSGMFGAAAPEPGETPDEDVVWAEDTAEAEAILGEVLDTGVPVVSREHQWRSGQTPSQDRTVSVSAFRMADARSEPSGVTEIVRDVTEQDRIRRQRELLHSASSRIGFSLDVNEIAQALADVVLGNSDLVTVDLNATMFSGDVMAPAFRGDTTLVRAAFAGVDHWPEGMLGVGESQPRMPDTTEVEEVREGHPVRLTRDEVIHAMDGNDNLTRLFVPDDAHSLVVSPVFARGMMLGAICAWRTGNSPAFDDDEVRLLGDIGSRAALGVDNARRYAYEHRTALGLQEGLLPRAVSDLTPAHTVGAYAPAGGRNEVGGDWFDVIELPSLRVAFVVGDVVGRGLPAAAGMGRLRTAVQNFALLELEPAEVLTRIEDLVQRLAAETPTIRSDTSGATCLYAVYDPTTRQCTFANAGQPAPLLVRPDGHSEQLDVPPGPPLGVGGMPYQSTTITLEPGGILALFTDGLLELEPYTAADGANRVEQRLAELYREGRSLEQMGDHLLEPTTRTELRDDIAVLLARTNAVDPDSVATWEFPAEAASVAAGRSAAARQLDAWGLPELAFTTELIVSELVTNAVRHAWGPIGVRLIRDEVLICEVSDPSNTQPRLMRAGDTDEGGRGLFIVAQCTSRCGCRYASQGKTMWTEQSLKESENAHLVSLPE
ncbi:SpoIIE family protein phosphatase [Streptomyces sp. TS71-3]|uniref:ATP-binding SpoIIE family protein phosphatase n=1 Tax=Streptomyces sp. TS71-3 TaxID=2733862 RepID=UPI001B287B15|nr:SpoIIE family protein phosphatase [Streptomyces sp. TS71-3]GHJ40796.1 hypothetical protein Sm713_64050 [Streptomyces sp. TS71-3]